MTDDLRQALSDIAGGAAASARRAPGDLRPAVLVAEARRRRRRFQAQALGTGLAASAVLGVGGLAVADAVREDPRPPVDDFQGISPAFTRQLPGCFEPLETDPVAGDGWLVRTEVPDLSVGDRASVAVALGMADDGEYVAQGATHRGAVALLVHDGLVVGMVEAAGEGERDVEATLDAQDDLGFDGEVVACDGIELEDGTYEAYVALELRPAWFRLPDGSEAVTDADFGWHVVGPLEVEVGDRTWTDVAAAELPREVPLVAGRVIRSQVHADGARWRVTVEVEGATGSAAYAAVETPLLDAGFTRTGEPETADATSTSATFAGGGYEVAVQVDLSNGAYAGYEIAHDGDSAPLVARTVLPEGDASLPFGQCGSLVASSPALPPVDVLQGRLEIAGTTARPGASVQVWASTSHLGRAMNLVESATGPRVVAVRDSVVVGAGGLFAEVGGQIPVGADYWDAGTVGLLDLVVCEPERPGRVTAGNPLPEGDYELWSLAEVTWLDAETDLGFPEDPVRVILAHPDARRGTVLSEPVALRVEGEPAEPRDTRAESAHDVSFPPPSGYDLPACGSSAPDVSSGMFRVEHPEGPFTLDAEGLLGTRAALRYVGPGRVSLFPGSYLEYSIVRDGVVVGEFQDPGSDGGQLRMRHGTSITRTEAGLLVVCDQSRDQLMAGGSHSLPPGRYDLYPSIYVAPDYVIRTDGSRVDNPQQDGVFGAQVYGEPVELVVE